MVDLIKYSCIVWDWNGTLLDDAWLCVDVMNGMLKERGMPLKTLEEYRDLFDFPVKDYYSKLGYDFNSDPFDEVGMEFIVRYNKRQHEAPLHTGVLESLVHLKTKGFRMAILSAREQNELIAETHRLGVNSFFESIYGLDDHFAHGKTEVGKRLVLDLGIPVNEILFVGDTRHDAEVAVNLGVDCILIAAGHHTMERLKKTGFPVIPTLNEIINHHEL